MCSHASWGSCCYLGQGAVPSAHRHALIRNARCGWFVGLCLRRSEAAFVACTHERNFLEPGMPTGPLDYVDIFHVFQHSHRALLLDSQRVPSIVLRVSRMLDVMFDMVF